jgi:uncharacterized protein
VRLGIVSGQRRQGKTYLLDAITSAFGGFSAPRRTLRKTESLAGFGRALAATSGGGRYALADWDEALRRLCGSAMSVMGDLLSGNAPLRGRASLELVVRSRATAEPASTTASATRRGPTRACA